jgi:hypothetical protein
VKLGDGARFIEAMNAWIPLSQLSHTSTHAGVAEENLQQNIRVPSDRTGWRRDALGWRPATAPQIARLESLREPCAPTIAYL